MVVPSGSFNLRVGVPVILGSIPLQGLTPFNLPPLHTALAEPSAPVVPGIELEPAPGLPAYQRECFSIDYEMSFDKHNFNFFKKTIICFNKS